MLLRLTLLVSYFILLFLSSRVVEYSNTVIELTGLKLVCDILPFATWIWSGLCVGDSNNGKNTTPDGKPSTSNGDHTHSKDNDGLSKQTDGDSSLLEETNVVEHNVEFSSYANLREHVEDTKASVWLVVIEPRKGKRGRHAKKDNLAENHRWDQLTRRLSHYGVRTGIYRCYRDPILCIKHKVDSVAVLLTMPKGSQPKGTIKVEFYHFNSDNFLSQTDQESLYKWVKRKLQVKVATTEEVDYSSKLSFCNFNFHGNTNCPTLNLVYQSKQSTTPLFLSALSVRFTGRINFLHVKVSHTNSEKLIVVGNSTLLPGNDVQPFLNYTYGRKKGESFKYTNIEIFLRTLHPEVNDIFMFAIVIVNMLCSLELIIQRGGPLRRTLYLVWITIFANAVLLSAWLPLVRLSQLPIAKPVMDTCLNVLQVLMVSDAASMVREDLVNISKHVHVIVIGFFCYGMICGFLKYRITHGNSVTFRPLLWFHEDVDEIQQMFHSLLSFQPSSFNYFTLEEGVERFLHRLSIPDLWLHPPYPEDFFVNLPVWRFCQYFQNYSKGDTKVMLDTKVSKKVEDNINHDTADDMHLVDATQDYPVPEKVVTWEMNKDISKGRTGKNCKCDVETMIPYVMFSHECSICLEGFTCGTEVKVLPCGHLFHVSCVGGWISSGGSRRHLRCPMCRWPMYKRKKCINAQKSAIYNATLSM